MKGMTNLTRNSMSVSRALVPIYCWRWQQQYLY